MLQTNLESADVMNIHWQCFAVWERSKIMHKEHWFTREILFPFTSYIAYIKTSVKKYTNLLGCSWVTVKC